MEFIVTPELQGIYIISCPSKMDWDARIEVSAVLKDTVEGSGLHGIILDLDKVRYMNSAGLGAIFIVQKFAKERNARVVMAGPTPTMMRLLQTANVPKVIPVAEDLDHARELLGSPLSDSASQ